MRRAAAMAVLAAAALAAPAAPARTLWPPPSGAGTLFVHFGEEHLTDPDGKRILPRVVAGAAAYRPTAVVLSGDKSNDGTVENLTAWRAAMAPFTQAGIPYFAAVGNHDRKKKPGFPDGIDPTGSLANYEQVFAGEPYPFGDAPAPAGFAPARPADDPAGASSHYYFDVGRTRWIVLDNSCYTFSVCDGLQSPPLPDAQGDQGQLDFLTRTAAEARRAGRTVLVDLHMPTQDPRPGHSQPTPQPHTMGEGTAPDNGQLEAAAQAAGVSGVFAGHIKGQWLYRSGNVAYYTDGGGGGAVYVGSSEKTGVDYGYWHGFRLVRVLPDGRLQTDAVPVFDAGGIRITAPASARRGSVVALLATGHQPAQAGPKVDLELRPPAPSRPNAANLPVPAYVWTSGDPAILAPVRGKGDDPRDDPATENQSGRFRARCPGRGTVAITSGAERATATIAVASAAGRIARSVSARARTVRRGRPATVAAVRLAQPARVRAVLRRGGRTVARLLYACRSAGRTAVRWPRTVPGRVRPGRYALVVSVLSDRAPATRSLRLRVRSGR